MSNIDPRRWWALATVVGAQFMFVVDAFIVNVAIPAIRTDLQASAAEIEAVIAAYQIAYATMVITGGRLGDIWGRRRTFIVGVLGFTATSLACGFAQTGTELVLARLAQGATAALIVPQVLATIHSMFPDAARARAFGIYGVALGLGGAAGFLLGGLLVSFDPFGLGWRAIFFVNGPVGLVIAVAAWRLLPKASPHAGARLDLGGATLLFVGLLLVIGPVLLGNDAGWAPWLWPVMAAGMTVLALLLRFERGVARRDGVPLLEFSLLADRIFLRGLVALFAFHLGNTSFYLVMTLFMQGGLGFTPFDGGLAVVPLALAFVLASRQGAARAARRGAAALIDGCAVQFTGLAGIAVVIAIIPAPSMPLLMVPLAVFGYGQGLVMAPLFALVLATVPAAHAGAASGMLATAQQIAAASGISLAGAVYFGVERVDGHGIAALAALAALALTVLATALLLHRRRSVPHLDAAETAR